MSIGWGQKLAFKSQALLQSFHRCLKETGLQCTVDRSWWLPFSWYNVTMWKQIGERYWATWAPPVLRLSFACLADNRLKVLRVAFTFEQWNAKVICHHWWIPILSDWSWQTPSHQAHLDGQRMGGHFALMRWLRHRNGEEANDNGEEGGEVRGVQLGLIHQLLQLKQKRMQLVSPIIRWLLLHYRRWHTTFSLMALHRGGTRLLLFVQRYVGEV